MVPCGVFKQVTSKCGEFTLFFFNKVIGIHLDLHDVSLCPHGCVIQEPALVLSSSEDFWRRCSSPCQFEGNVPLNLIGSETACFIVRSVCCAGDIVSWNYTLWKRDAMDSKLNNGSIKPGMLTLPVITINKLLKSSNEVLIKHLVSGGSGFLRAVMLDIYRFIWDY